jgi:hypothetical protein
MTNTKTKEDALNNIKNSAHELQDSFNNVANQAGRRVRKMFNSANNDFSEASDKVTSEIRSNPIRSSFIALGAGLLLGLIFSSVRGSK